MRRFWKVVRRGTLILILLAPAVGIAWVRTAERYSHQEANLSTLFQLLLTGVLLILWVLFLSGLRWKRRAWIVGGVVAVLALLSFSLRIRGVSGDLLPILEWRFKPSPELGGRDRSTASSAGPIAGPTARRVEHTWLDSPQFLGAHRNATVDGVEIDPDWSRSPPREVWRRPVGAGWSGFAVAGDAVFTQEQRGDDEVVSSYGLLDGASRWSHADKARFDTVIAGVGPRATPSVDERRVYAVGARGLLNCLDRETGRPLWSRNFVEENGGRVNEWGVSCSPLLHRDLVIVSAGGKEDRSLVAYRAATGEPVWHGGTARSDYSSPLAAELSGRTQLLILNHGTVAAHDPESGRVLWEVPWPRSNPTPPQVLPVPPDRFLVSSGYGVGSALYRLEPAPGGGLLPRELWKNLNLKAKFANSVLRGRHVFGLDDGILVCLDVETGARAWKQGRYGHGQMVLAGGLLLITAESGEVFLLEANPERHVVLGSFRALSDKTWNTPAFAAPYLLVRNDQEAVCFQLPLKAPAKN
jgi:outer membrane protein assembly factor BamB